MDRQGKENLRKETADALGKVSAVILAEYRGLSVADVTNLRVELRKSDAVFKVVKNRVVKKAIELEQPDFGQISDDFKGPIGVVYAFGDAAQTTKTALEFGKDHPEFVVKGGFFDKNRVSENELKAIADLPSKEVLLGQIVGSLVSPHRGLLGVLNGVSRQLVQVINAIKDTKQA